MKIGIYGCGAMGTVLGAFLSREGLNVELIDIYEEHVTKLNRDGATLIGFEKWTVPVKAIVPSQMEGIYDLIILLCKQTANKEAFKIIEQHINGNSSILTLQNGFPEPSLVEKFGEEQTLGGTVLWGATFVAPGISQVTEPLSAKAELFEIGTMSGEVNERVRKAAEILGKMGPTQITNNLIASRWTKLVANSSMSGMSAALACTFGEILNNEEAMEQIGSIGKEAGLVCKAAGHSFASLFGADLDKILKDENQNTETEWIKWVKSVFEKMGAAKASMLQDLEKGKKTEVDMINGFICELGRKHGIHTPVNDTIVEIVHGIEAGKYPMDISNLRYFKK